MKAQDPLFLVSSALLPAARDPTEIGLSWQRLKLFCNKFSPTYVNAKIKPKCGAPVDEKQIIY